MPEMLFHVRWPDDTESVCYSPSLVLREHLAAGQSYALDEFLARTRTALEIASERVRVKYGFACSRAADQLAEIEARVAYLAAQEQQDAPTVTVTRFEP